MTVPGWAVTAAAFLATVDDPGRFRRSSSVGAYFRQCILLEPGVTGEVRFVNNNLFDFAP